MLTFFKAREKKCASNGSSSVVNALILSRLDCILVSIECNVLTLIIMSRIKFVGCVRRKRNEFFPQKKKFILSSTVEP